MLRPFISILFRLLCVVLLTTSCLHKVEDDGFGIDVSRHNGKIDWPTVKEHHKLQFVYIKATEGASYSDPLYTRNITGARKAGFDVGSYHYFRMSSSAHTQFNNSIQTIGSYKQDLLPMVDVETTDNYSVKETCDSLNVFICLVKAYFGKSPIIYATNRSYNEICGPSYNKYHLYIGRYGKHAPSIRGDGMYTIWQYSETGTIRGIPRPVDLAKFNSCYSIDNIKL